MAQKKTTFSRADVSGFRISREDVTALAGRLLTMPADEILRAGEYMEGRHDVIGAGAAILDQIVQRFGFSDVVVSERGVRYGILIRDWQSNLQEQLE
jgi:exopolyphosphatase/guanosine-5'-triphosphate,3'-diphosphate pyrophosphatase